MEIYGTTTLDLKKKIESVGDVIATVRGRTCVVSAMGFEDKFVGHDVRLLAKEVSEDSLPNARSANAEIQAWVDSVLWPQWPRADKALGG